MRNRLPTAALLLLTLTAAGCPASSGPGPADGDLDFELDPSDPDPVEGEAEPAWEFDRDDYRPVNGWILLDADETAIRESIAAAAGFGVNHIQLSHDIIMNIEDILGTGAEVEQRIARLNLGIGLAHERGMKAYVWTHEFSGAGPGVCYEPGGGTFLARAAAYREGLARIPHVDGVVLMFGSAPTPPWYTICTCDWCEVTYGGDLLESPPQAERLRLVTEQIGGVVVNELGRELLIRTFVHEPAELGWHSEGLAAARGVAFTGMHKSDVQDWQPYNPPERCHGEIGNHPSVMEFDLAGEYLGLSVLPFCAPEYVWYRLRWMRDHRGVGAVSRVQRGTWHALGTPNEVNLHAMATLLDDIAFPRETIWDEFLATFYRLEAADPAQPSLKRILKDTFPIRLKSHYVLNVWALEKGSDIPSRPETDQFRDRGEMPKWDPDYQEIWDRLDRPDRQTVLWIWQEGSEAVELAAGSLERFAAVAPALDPDAADDLDYRLRHQLFAARAWRGVELYIWARMAIGFNPNDPDLPGWAAWARGELSRTAAEMDADGLSGAQIASPARIRAFVTATEAQIAASPIEPPTPLFSPLEIVGTTATGARLRFAASRGATVSVDFGTELPDFGSTIELGPVPPATTVEFELDGLSPATRHVVRLRAAEGGLEQRGGEYWVFTPDG